jgi:hypothetical protein
VGRLTAGYVPFGSHFYDQNTLGEISARAEAELAAAGIDLIRTDPVVAAGDEVRALAELATRGGGARERRLGVPGGNTALCGLLGIDEVTT